MVQNGRYMRVGRNPEGDPRGTVRLGKAWRDYQGCLLFSAPLWLIVGDTSAEPPDWGQVTACEWEGVRREIVAEAEFSSMGGRRRMLGTFLAAAAASERG